MKRKCKTDSLCPLVALVSCFTFMIALLGSCSSGNPVGALGAAVEAQSAPNLYHVNLQWTADDSASTLVLQRRHGDSIAIRLADLSAGTQSYVDAKVDPGETYRYELGSLDEGAYSVFKEVAVTIPKDMLIKDGVAVAQITGINRLFLTANTKLVLNGKALVIDVGEIISDNASIESFPEGQAGAPNSPGREGSSITIKAKSGRGVLNIFARGENGGVGIPGQSGGTGIRGSHGNNGQCGYHDNDEGCRVTREQYQELTKGAAQGGFVGEISQQFLRRFYCKVATENGGQGLFGLPGSNGGRGAAGGSSGSVSVQIDNPTSIEIRPHQSPGQGGEGGPGGSGGQGGPGGYPGMPDHLGICRAGVMGPSGLAGKTGTTGVQGPPGTSSPTCLRLGTATFGDCGKL